MPDLIGEYYLKGETSRRNIFVIVVWFDGEKFSKSLPEIDDDAYVSITYKRI